MCRSYFCQVSCAHACGGVVMVVAVSREKRRQVCVVCANVQICSHFFEPSFCLCVALVGATSSGRCRRVCLDLLSGLQLRPRVRAYQKVRERCAKEARRLAMQAIKENQHFRLFSDTQLYGTLVEGKSLVDTMIAAKFAHVTKDKSAPKFGSGWYSALAAAYGGGSASSDGLALSAANADSPLRESLVQAAMSWDDCPRKAQPLFDWLMVETKDLFVFIFCFCVCVFM